MTTGGPGTAHGRQRMIERAVSNLIDNAVKYTPRSSVRSLKLAAAGPEAGGA